MKACTISGDKEFEQKERKSEFFGGEGKNETFVEKVNYGKGIKSWSEQIEEGGPEIMKKTERDLRESLCKDLIDSTLSLYLSVCLFVRLFNIRE